MPDDDYKFPHEMDEENQGKPEDDIEIDVDAEGDVSIEIEDDTPERDRKAKPLDRAVEDPSDEEIENYTQGAQSRIKQLTHARHDERRAKEAALREKQELERMAQAILDENKRLKEYVNSGQATFAENLQARAEAEMEMARRKYKEAQESYDSDAMLAAQENLTDAKMKLENAKNFKPTPLQVERDDVKTYQQVPEAPQLDEKTLRWQAKNQWFGSAGYEEMTAFALGLHQKLVATGIDPRSDEYFDRVDGRLKQVFPEVFGTSKESDAAKAEPTKKPGNVVAPASRSSGAKKVIKLTTTQARLAEKYGLTHKQYAQEVLKLEANNG